MNTEIFSVELLAPVFLVIFWGLMFLFPLVNHKQRRDLREIPGFQQLRRAVGMAVEAGSRLQIALGKGSLYEKDGAAGFAGLTILQRIAQAASISDRPPVASSGDSLQTILSQDTLQTTYRSARAESQYDPAAGRLTGVSPFSYAAGALAVIHDENVSASILAGNFGSEAGLLAAAAEQTNGQLIGGTDNLSGQAVLYVTSQEPLIGEEIFAGGAYLGSGSAHHASLQVQDIARWVIIAIVLLGAFARLAGLI